MNQQHVIDTYVARIWLEHGDNGDTSWRGHIRHVQGEEDSYFQNLTEMSDFLFRVSGVATPPFTPSDFENGPNSTTKVTSMTRKE